MTTKSTRLRTDAAANRSQLLDVARQTFKDDGLGVSMSEIARRARLGVATLYRHFPSKGDLVAEAFADPMGECVGMLDDALADPDPWRAFCRVIEEVCEMQAHDRGFSAALVSALPGTSDFGALREHAETTFAELARRAKASGDLRDDFSTSDLMLILLANSGVRAGAGDAAPAASRRLTGYLLQSFRASAADVPLPPQVPLPLDVSAL